MVLLRLYGNNDAHAVIGINAPSRDYSIPGTSTSRIFTTIGASANLVFAFNTGMLPEIQVGQIILMSKSSSFQFTVIEP